MPTEQPNTAPLNASPEPRDDLNAAAVLSDDQLDQTPGGGGILREGPDPDPLGGSQKAPTGTSPNAPQDTGVASGDVNAEREAQLRSLDEAEGHPS
ncbi:hypothetical protein [uncultured Sphingomonas sp.]|uniref:hypothetical protein n=1 Tax=uncultured Sphingomonas sp. TaxID=158754 RepID=UPI0025FADA53|nr:hypothetical protein [uncultured Sphingomonas sp.]